MRPANHSVTAQVLLGAAVKVTAVESALERRRAGFRGVGPTDGTEDAVFIVEVIVNASVTLVGDPSARRHRIEVILRIVPAGNNDVGGGIQTGDFPRSRVHAGDRNDVTRKRGSSINRACARSSR